MTEERRPAIDAAATHRGVGECQTLFHSALLKYLRELPENKLKKEFFNTCYDPTISPPTHDTVLYQLKRLEEQTSQSGSSTFSKIIKKVVTALRDYDDVIKTLISADPMPSALIWGALSIIIKTAHRQFELKNHIKDHLVELSEALGRFRDYEPLWGNCTTLQRHLCESYIYVFRFMSRVYKELRKSGLKTLVSATTSKSTNKLEEIVTGFRAKLTHIEGQIVILEGKNSKEERVKSQEERELQTGWRLEDLRKDISDWLKDQKATSASQKRYDGLLQEQMSGTFEWTQEHPRIAKWMSAENSSEQFLPVHASPGSGKSTLCAFTIQKIRARSGVVAFHFYRFDEHFDAPDVLKSIASQLYHALVSERRLVSELQPLKRIIDDETKSSSSRSQDLIHALIEYFPLTWIFLDGLDEETQQKRWESTSPSVNFLLALTQRSSKVRLWSTSQRVSRVEQIFSKHSFLDVGINIKQDLTAYLAQGTKEILSNDEWDAVIHQTEGADSGFFLWAKFLMADLKSANSPRDREKVILDGPTLDEYYKRVFKRFDPSNLVLASRIFSLVAFSRRPLRVCELREAIGILEMKEEKAPVRQIPTLRWEQLPFIHRMKELFAPLIVLDTHDEENEDTGVCRLYHSAILRFLERNPDILCVDTVDTSSINARLRIERRVIADACILYLFQKRYSALLRKKTVGDIVQWVDVDGSPAKDHRFLPYSSKFWDKHFDWRISPFKFERNRERVKEKLKGLRAPEMIKTFLESSNFLTCIQVQSLFLEGQFIQHSTPSMDDPFYCFKRAFPDWFGILIGQRYRKGYQEYLVEWAPLLDSSCLATERWTIEQYRGEINRCWWGSLGKQSFLSKCGDAFNSFRFEKDATSDSTFQAFTGIAESGEKVLTVDLRHDGPNLSMKISTWRYASNTYVTGEPSMLAMDGAGANLPQYIQCISCLSNRSDRAKVAGFNSECNLLRVGTQIFVEERNGDFAPVNLPDVGYVEEMDLRGNVMAIASRRRRLKPKDCTLLPPGQCTRCKISYLNQMMNTLEGDLVDDSLEISEDILDFHWDTPSDSDNESSGSKSSSSISHHDKVEQYHAGSSSGDSVSSQGDGDSHESSSEEEIDEAYESWSECSSQADKQQELESDEEEDQASNRAGDRSSSDSEEEKTDPKDREDVTSTSSEPSSDSERESSDSSGSPDVLNDPEDDSDLEEPNLDPSHFRYGRLHRYAEDFLSSDEDEFQYEEIIRKLDRKRSKQKNSPFIARLSVYDASSPSNPERIFSFSSDLTFPLYHSPPIIHPNHPLVVWPLGEGKILFGDFDEQSYFIRKLKPSTTATRHIFMKCRFSPCGKYLHIAALEGQTMSTDVTQNPEDHMFSMALVTHTFQLCSSQPTRTPPGFVHKSRLDLGSHKQLPVSELPFTLTWTARMLYVTHRGILLKVYRVDLFPSSCPAHADNAFPILRPKELIPLPSTAIYRDVHFLPAEPKGKHARLIMGAHSTFPHTFPPIGCFLHEKRDLGGWVRSGGTQDIPNPRGDGRLIMPLEKFDPEEDCDLEPFLFLA